MACYRCTICLEFVSNSIQEVVKHLGRVHRNEPNFHVLCGVEGCAKTFRNFLSFKNHLIRKHNILARNDEVPPALENPDDDEIDERVNNGREDEQLEENPFNLNEEQAKLLRTNALCLLKFKEKGRVPQTVVDSFVENATLVTQTSIDLFKAGVTSCLQKAGLSMHAIPELPGLFDVNLISNPFTGIDSESLQYKY